MGSGHARFHQAENQAHGREEQVPSRRGRLGVIIPLVTIVAAVAFAIYVSATAG